MTAICIIVAALTVGTLVTVCVTECVFNCSPLMLIIGGELNNKEFDVLMDLVFNDPAAKLDEFNMRGGGYECWIGNGYFSFKVNGVSRFTPRQKIKFFKRLKAWKADKQLKKNDRLNRAKINEILFQRQVDSILEKE